MSRAAAARRLLLAALWTAALAASLYGLDRFLLGTPARGWQRAADPDQIPAEVRPVAAPAYLPERLGWPPDAVLYRVGESPGWWLGAGVTGGSDPDLWIGRGAPPAPEALGDARACVEGADPERCPEPWHHLSGRVEGEVVHVVGRLDPGELRRILAGLHPRE
ncbi:MAG: hypothetical protein ACQEXJ_00860 [Myxococcota bacterium]